MFTRTTASAIAAAFLCMATFSGGPAMAEQPAAPASPMADAAAKKDIVDTAVAAGDFKTLVAAVKAADLVDTLKGAGPFTVFAPNDAAFAKIPKEKLDELLKPENKAKLASILTYHVVPGKVDSAAASKLTSAKTVNGKELKISKKDDGLYINDAKVIKADIEASNGVIHVIDTVVMPE